MNHKFVMVISVIVFVVLMGTTWSAEIPLIVQNLQNQDVKVKSLGMMHGLKVWQACKNSKEKTLFTTPDDQAFIVGNIYNNQGLMTISHSAPLVKQRPSTKEFWHDLESSAWFVVGSPNTPYIYLIMDPSCHYCFNLLEKLSNHLKSEELHVRIILVSFLSEDSYSNALKILSADDPSVNFTDFKCNANALKTITSTIVGQHKADVNNALLLKWQISATPLMIYTTKNDAVKVIEGIPKDLKIILQELR